MIIRRGPGIRLVRSDHADIVVTVDDAERGAGLVNDLLRRRVGWPPAEIQVPDPELVSVMTPTTVTTRKVAP